MTLIQLLKNLSPTEFENVIYDVCVKSGLRNAVWRTPGPDGGRDIEGFANTVDFSGQYHSDRWYVECKRYSNTLDWPTVREKISYADNHAVDSLLIATTANISPQCRSEISIWNSRRMQLQVRTWDATNIATVLSKHPDVLVKHGLWTGTSVVPASFLPASRLLSSVTLSAYSELVFRGEDLPSLELAASLSELLIVRLGDAEAGRPFVRRESGVGDMYDWLTVRSESGATLERFDKFGLRAILSLIRHLLGARTLDLKATPQGIHLDIDPTLLSDVGLTAMGHLATIGVMAGIELVSDKQVLLIPQER